MRHKFLKYLGLVLAALMTTAVSAGDKDKPEFAWRTVINNNDVMPPLDVRHFNSYNPPSVNMDGMVVIRARSRGGHGGGAEGGDGDHGGGGQGGGGNHGGAGGEGGAGDHGGTDSGSGAGGSGAGGSGHSGGQPTHGIYVRDMSRKAGPIERILDRAVEVPQPNNLGTTFVETPSFPRIDMHSDTIATRGNHQPVHRYNLEDDSETRAGTTGIYANPYGELVTGAAKLGDAPGYGFYRVPEFSGIRFEVFPGAPSISNGSTIVFKGNYTIDDVGRTGVYFRHLWPGPSGGDSEPVMIANNTDTLIPGTHTVFGSTAPPNAAAGKAVFAGFDDEDAPTLGGIYLAPLQFQAPLTTLVSIGGAVPGEPDGETFTALGEGSSFDGRNLGFWAAWGEKTRTVRLYCAEEGNRDMIAYCNRQLVCSDSGEIMGDPESVCNDDSDPYSGSRCYVDREVPVNQGIFVHDIKMHQTHVVAKTGEEFDEFLFWKYSGKPPCAGEGHSEEGSEEDGESVRWRSSAFLSVGGPRGAAFRAAFKARTTEDELGIFMKKGPGNQQTVSVADTTMEGRLIDPEAPEFSTVVEVGLEREGLRGNWLAINAKMGVEGGEEEDGMAGIYIARLP